MVLVDYGQEISVKFYFIIIIIVSDERYRVSKVHSSLSGYLEFTEVGGHWMCRPVAAVLQTRVKKTPTDFANPLSLLKLFWCS